MGKKLIITEKPSVAQDYAKVFQVSGKRNGYIENNTYVITWCVGHLVEMVYPEEYDIRYKKWMLQDLTVASLSACARVSDRGFVVDSCACDRSWSFVSPCGG